jgi:hypothetical protein
MLVYLVFVDQQVINRIYNLRWWAMLGVQVSHDESENRKQY